MTEGAYHLAFLSEDGAPGVIFYSRSLAQKLGIPSADGRPIKVDWWSVEWTIQVVNERPRKVFITLVFGKGDEKITLPDVEVDLQDRVQAAFIRRLIERRMLAFVIAGSRGDLPMSDKLAPLIAVWGSVN